jgi:hypothetical protein
MFAQLYRIQSRNAKMFISCINPAFLRILSDRIHFRPQTLTMFQPRKTAKTARRFSTNPPDRLRKPCE